ncbi:MAG: CHAT domain-containing protein [Caldilineaceae bacterium]|nr:CHAT domain-containing protein [Caldilineaceae bacterium]
MAALYAALRRTVKTMPGCQYRNFDITIGGERAPYPVMATYAGLSAEGSFAYDATQPRWRDDRATFHDPRRAPGAETLNRVGSALFEELLREDLRDLWLAARAGSEESGAPKLRLRLLLHPPAVAALPWESLYDRRRQQALGADPALALVRVSNRVGYVERARPLEAALPIKILVVAVDDPNGIDASAEIARVEETLAGLTPHKIQLRRLAGRVDIHTLRRHLHDEDPDILHIISHGDADGLLLWSEDSEPELVSGNQIQAMLRQINSLKLVFLNACLAGQPDDNRPFADVAGRLLQTGLPAVIAMQFEIRDRSAANFAGFLYEALVSGDCPGAVDRAVSIARSNLFISAPHRLDYITPVLWLNTEDGVIFRLPAQTQTAPMPISAPPSAEEKLILDPQLAEKDAWLAALPQYTRSKLSMDARIVLDNRQTCIEEIRHHLAELRRLHEEQQGGFVRISPIQQTLARFERQRREVDRLTQILIDNVGPGDA